MKNDKAYILLFKAKTAVLWGLFYFLPINSRKIVFQNRYGEQGYADNPGAIADEIINQNLGFKIIWVTKDTTERNGFPGCVKLTKIDSIAYIYHMRTSRFWVDNCRKLSFVRKKSGQIYIQTWHGGFPFKKIEQDAETKLDDNYIRLAKKDSSICDLILSNSKASTRMYKTGFWYSGPVLESGSPRNDIFFKDNQTAYQEIREKLNIPSCKKIVLYAPTFRRDERVERYALDYPIVIDSLRSRFGGDWVALLRLHPVVASKSRELGLNSSLVIDVSSYPEMQDLLLVSDVLVTDYSSSMFDFMLTGRPCFLYATDIDEFKDDRDFYYDITKLPFDIAETQPTLTNAINKFAPDVYKARVKAFMEESGALDSGDASDTVIRWMLGIKN